MSEYQYYEFQTIGSHLSEEAMEEMSDLSSRAEVSRTSAAFNYSYGDFPADPIKVLMRHFDALLYLANWGSRRLAFRFPISAVDYQALRRFAFSETISVTKTDAHVLVDMILEDEGDTDWIEGEGALDGVIGLYDDLLAGDYRALFLLWLQAAFMEGLGEEEEGTKLRLPPIPPGLRSLSGAHRTLMGFFGIDPDLVAATAPFSAPIRQVTNEDLAREFDAMAGIEHTRILRRMALGESPTSVATELRRKLRSAALSSQEAPSAPPPPASAGVLFAKARQSKVDFENEAKNRKEAERLRRLAELDRNQARLWARVDELIAAKTTKAYDEAIGILRDLRDLALHQQQREAFVLRVEAIKAGHPKLVGLLSRINKAKLV